MSSILLGKRQSFFGLVEFISTNRDSAEQLYIVMVDFCQNIFWVNEKHSRLAKIYIFFSGHMTKIATTPIYTINSLKLLQNQKANG